MAGGLIPYLVAFFAMLFSGMSALTLFYTVGHFDPPDAPHSEHLDRKSAD